MIGIEFSGYDGIGDCEDIWVVVEWGGERPWGRWVGLIVLVVGWVDCFGGRLGDCFGGRLGDYEG